MSKRNQEGCTSIKCPCPWRLCWACARDGVTDDRWISTDTGLCKFHEKNDKAIEGSVRRRPVVASTKVRKAAPQPSPTARFFPLPVEAQPEGPEVTAPAEMGPEQVLPPTIEPEVEVIEPPKVPEPPPRDVQPVVVATEVSDLPVTAVIFQDPILEEIQILTEELRRAKDSNPGPPGSVEDLLWQGKMQRLRDSIGRLNRTPKAS